MAIEIFKNDEEDILFGQDGNVFRTPYDFGKGFQNRMGLNNYILISDISVPLIPSTEMFWVRDINAVSLGENLSTRRAPTYNNYTRCAYNANTYLTKNTDSNSPSITIFNSAPSTYVQGGVSFLAVGLSGSFSGFSFVNGTIQNVVNGNSSVTDATTNAIIISGFKMSQVESNTPNGYNGNVFSRYMLFSRVLSEGEVRYHYDNKSGNELQSTLGLEIDLRMQFAEVINISGVDQPCVRDYSGNNRHAIIMNLPAGTAKEKVDYANANLFVPFIS